MSVGQGLDLFRSHFGSRSSFVSLFVDLKVKAELTDFHFLASEI